MRKYLFIVLAIILTSKAALAITNIDEFNKYAWNDPIGSISFYDTNFSTNEVVVSNSKITGSGVFCSTANPCASSTNYVSLDCATSPTGNICGGTPGTWFVSNDSLGNLAGWAWNDEIGWISFCGNASGSSTFIGGTWVCPAVPTYQVIVRDNGTGSRDFSGWAWNNAVGWISFNCSNTGSCGTVSYKTTTYWPGSAPTHATLTSNTFDTCPSGAASCINGVNYNYILWKGVLGDVSDANRGANSVKFRLATSSCLNGATDPGTCAANVGWGGSKTSGDGAFVGPSGGASADFYGPANPDQAIAIKAINHNNKRYYRYEVSIGKSASSTSSPAVQDVVVNWSF